MDLCPYLQWPFQCASLAGYDSLTGGRWKIGLVLCLWSFIAWRGALPTRLIALQIFVVAGIVLNAIVTGALSGPYDRYLARVIWLILFVGLVSVCCITRIHRDKQVFKRLRAR